MLHLSSAYSNLTIDPTGGSVQSWQICRLVCAGRDNPVHTVLRGPAATPVARLSAADPLLDRHLQRLRYNASRTHRQDTLILLSEPLADKVRLRQRFTLLDKGRRLALTVDLIGTGAKGFAREHRLRLKLSIGTDFGHSGSAGFTGLVETARWISLIDGEVSSQSAESVWVPASTAGWIGIRNRFWALLVNQSPDRLAARAGRTDDDYAITVNISDLSSFELLAGPVEPGTQAQQPDKLQALWVSGLWNWLRWLAMGLYYLLEGLVRLIGNYGLAIIALALAVKILMLPLTLIAARWQQQVNTIQTQLQPQLRRIKADYRGEEQAQRVLALHREHGVTLLYPVRSLFGVFIQLPVFIGAFDMLLHHPGLGGIGFLWITDLARPDRFMALAFTLPFFGSYLNLLPFLMTGINLIAARQAGAAGLDYSDHRRRRQWLYGMALLFLVLFYTFPAGMVLYWTSTNLFHVLGERLLQFRHRVAATPYDSAS